LRDTLIDINALELINGAHKTLRNSQCLCDEAEVLHNHQMFARSYALSHFAREEFGKCLMLYRTAIDVLAGIKVDWKKLNKRFRDHKQKILNDIFISLILFGEIKPYNGRTMLSAIDNINIRKNECLYVDWKKNQFISPEEVVSEHKSKRNLDLAIHRIAKLSPILIELSDRLKSQSKDEILKAFPKEYLDDPEKFIELYSKRLLKGKGD
jgi:AbiV family abortive infection protein